MKYGSYPVTVGILEWISHRLDAVDYSSFCYWFERKKLIQLADDVESGNISRMTANRILAAYNRDVGMALTLDELFELDDTYIFSPSGDWIVYTDNIRALIRNAPERPNLRPLDSLAEGNGVRWVLLYQPEEHVIHALKTPHTQTREMNPSADQFANALVSGSHPAYVLPPEVHGIIKQEKENDCY